MTTLYRTVHDTGATEVPFGTMTEASLFVIRQNQPHRWKVELVSVDDVPQTQQPAEQHAPE